VTVDTNSLGTAAPGSVLFVHGSDEAYGSDRTLLRQMAGLRERGWTVRLMLPDDVPPGWLSRAASTAGIPIERLPLAVARRRNLRPAALPRYLVSIARARRGLRAVIRRDRPAIVHVNTSALLVGAVLGRPAGARLVWHIHEIIVRPRPLAWLFRSLPALTADRVVVISEAVGDHLLWLARRRGRLALVRNGIDPRIPAPLPGLASEAGPIVAFVGRLNHWKGYELFVEAIERVGPRFPVARFVIAGDPPPGEEWRTGDLADRIARAGLADRITTLGFVPDGAAVFDAAQIAVVPSTLPEPFGLVVVEAMQAGCAVIVSDHGGAREIVEPEKGSGVVVPPGDPDALARAIGDLLADPDRRQAMGVAARRRVAEAFSTARMVDDLESVYRDLLR
jgi:glycosyltransferase involved in cell wall biosynthesis